MTSSEHSTAYSETLAYLYTQLPMFSRVGKAAYKADLANTHALMDLLDHPEDGLRCVHIAGTNGKGSTSHMLASILQEAGYRTGLHTSPHLKDFRERFRINGAMIPEQAVTDFVQNNRERFAAIAPSFFEWGVGLTFDWFRAQAVDIAVLETGMGGRLDSTNVVTPEVCAITNIGLDHADLLGGTVEAIAAEKAGIMKPGIPVVIGEATGSVADLFRAKAMEIGAPILFVDQKAPLPYPLALEGPHQARNARTVLAVVDVLRGKGWRISDHHIADGLRKVLSNTGFAGRWQTIAEKPRTIADVGHNADGIRVVRDMLARTTYASLHIVLGTVNDKDVAAMLALLPPDARYYFCKADIPRGLEAEVLQERAATVGLHGPVYGSVREAVLAAQQAAEDQDLVLVTGSVFVVAEAI